VCFVVDVVCVWFMHVLRCDEIYFLQAIGPELTFYNTSKDVGELLNLSNKLLLAHLDAFCRRVLFCKWHASIFTSLAYFLFI